MAWKEDRGCRRGARSPAWQNVAEVLADFSELTEEDVRACLAFAADREKGTMIIPPAA